MYYFMYHVDKTEEKNTLLMSIAENMNWANIEAQYSSVDNSWVVKRPII